MDSITLTTVNDKYAVCCDEMQTDVVNPMANPFWRIGNRYPLLGNGSEHSVSLSSPIHYKH
jgi:hypothetical protein